MKSIVVVGSINLDLVANVARMPAEGETIPGTDFATYPGGKGANQAVAAGMLGAKTVMVGCLGDDLLADRLRKALEGAGVSTEAVKTVQGASGSAVILVTESAGNSIVVIPGANAKLRPEDMDAHRELFAAAGVILAQLEIPLDTVERLAQIAGELGVPLVLDPAPAQALSAETLKHVTWLTPNETETQILLSSSGEFVVGDAAAEAADRLLSTGVRNVILKMGERGVYLAGADVERGYVPPYRVHAVDTTAAGDAFNGGFAFALTQGMAPRDAAQFACAVAAVSVTRVGAQPSMPTLEEVDALRNDAVAAG
ncbi:MAG: ribokinase [Acidobacteriaceae bacterium]|nr:ribokinase [Acidobacteriaceae bacterium]